MAFAHFPALVLDPARKRLAFWQSSDPALAWKEIEASGGRWTQAIREGIGLSALLALQSVVITSDRSSFSDARSVALLANMFSKEINISIYEVEGSAVDKPQHLQEVLGHSQPKKEVDPQYFAEPNITQPNKEK